MEAHGMTPVRIKLSRRKGWRMPENTVNVARPGKWGNPFKVGSPLMSLPFMICGRFKGELVGSTLTQERAVEAFRIWTNSMFHGKLLAESAKVNLRGKNLACWCKPGDPCHADVLLEIANA